MAVRQVNVLLRILNSIAPIASNKLWTAVMNRSKQKVVLAPVIVCFSEAF
jgi:hypothetical protein